MLALTLACLALTSVANCAVLTEGSSDWWKTAVFYQIYPVSFKDSNDDGKGDLKGIMSKLEYLKEIGVTAAWLSPIFKSPQVDQGYDISDYRLVDPIYGTNDDFDQLLQKAKEVGIKIILDFVPNHTSKEHEWFQEAIKENETYKDFYIFKTTNNGEPPNNWVSLFKHSAWSQVSNNSNKWYLHQFASAQPDLNYRNPNVVKAMEDTLIFWLDKGVAGFRVDAVPYLIEDSSFADEPQSGVDGTTPDDYEYLNHTLTKDLDETYEIIYSWRQLMDDYTKKNGGDARIIMTEAYTDFENTLRYYGSVDGKTLGAHFTFNFDFISTLSSASTSKDIKSVIDQWLNNLDSKYVHNWVLGNHDNHRVATRFGTDHVDALTMLQSILPGIQVTYNGEEIGMKDGQVTPDQGHDPQANKTNFNEVSRDFERTPFQWDTSKNAGFSNAESSKLWLPVGEDYTTTNVELEKDDEKSHLNIYKTVVNLRHSLPREAPTETDLNGNVLIITRHVNNTHVYHYVYNRANEEANCNLPNKLQHSTYKIVAASGKSTYSLGDVVEQKLKLASNESLILSEIENSDDAASGLAVTYITFFSIIIGMLNIIQ